VERVDDDVREVTLEYVKEEDGEHLLKRIDFSSAHGLQLASFPEAMLPTLKELHPKYKTDYKCSIWLRQKPTLQVTPALPEATCGPLTINHLEKPVRVFVEKWEEREERVKQQWTDWTETQPTCGVYLKETNELVAWGVIYPWGALGALNVDEGHRKKGYCRAIVDYLDREMRARNLPLYSHVEDENEVSKKVHESLGFENVGDVYWITL
jgi:RimJ/RimL family protein N-acetyltransferase